jgi:hypothetical protein
VLNINDNIYKAMNEQLYKERNLNSQTDRDKVPGMMKPKTIQLVFDLALFCNHAISELMLQSIG